MHRYKSGNNLCNAKGNRRKSMKQDYCPNRIRLNSIIASNNNSKIECRSNSLKTCIQLILRLNTKLRNNRNCNNSNKRDSI
jgi:hypothetical protein